MKTKHRRDAGFSLTALIFFATAVSIAIAAIVPAYQMQAKRELEAELIFRGGEYTRALQKYHNKFGVWPTSIDQLVSTNNMRFIRRAYKDPLTGKDFRLITLNPNGSVNGSKLYMQSQNIGNNQSMFGNNVQQGGQGQTNIQQQPNNNTNGPANGLQNNTSGLGNTGLGNTGLGNNSFGNSPGQTPGGNNNTFGFTSSMGGQQNQTGQSNPAAGGGTFRVGGGTNPPPLGGPGGSGQTNPFSSASNPSGGGGTPVSGGGIIGIASDDEKDSIMVYNNRQKYDEWEFYAILGQGQQPNGQQNQQNQQRNPAQGGPGQTNPFANTQTQPFGPPPANPLGGGVQNNTTTGPFGFGGNQPMPNTPGKLP